jgi:hypothetical protein
MQKSTSNSHFNTNELPCVVEHLRVLAVLGLTVISMTQPLSTASARSHVNQSTQPIVTLGTAAQYALLGQNLNLHNVTITGNVGVGFDPASAIGMMSVGSPSTVSGITYKDPQATVSGATGPSNLQGGITTQPLGQAFADALTAYNAALALTPDVTIGEVKTNTTIQASHGGQYVVRVAGDIVLGGSNSLTLAPAPNEMTKFVVIVEGKITLGGSSIIGSSSAAGAKDVLFVVKGTGADLTTKINNFVHGTILAPYRKATFHGFRGAYIGGTQTVKLMSDGQVTHVGYEPPLEPKAVIGDFVWNDSNSNGVQDFGELGIPNVMVTLQDCNNNTLAMQTTDASGLYQFATLAAGCYVVVFTAPTDYFFSAQGQGGDATRDSDADPNTGKTNPINLGPAENNSNVDAGLNTCPIGQSC